VLKDRVKQEPSRRPTSVVAPAAPEV
jgi:hypothetical protein